MFTNLKGHFVPINGGAQGKQEEHKDDKDEEYDENEGFSVSHFPVSETSNIDFLLLLHIILPLF